MKRFILLTFLFLGWGFYELSGGTDFEPRVIASETGAEQVAVLPEPAPIVTQDVMPSLTRVDVAVPEPVASAEPSPIVIADAKPAEETVVTLVSLEQSGVLFARPLSAWDAETPEQQQIQSNPKDIRAIAANRVNMRNGPGTNFSVIRKMTRGTEVEILFDDGTGWVKLRPSEGGPVGWMAGRLLTSPSG
jgi:hypothetical protein